jgi:hypothetical protein
MTEIVAERLFRESNSGACVTAKIYVPERIGKVIGVDLQNRGSGLGDAVRNINYGGRLVSILVFGIARPLRLFGKARGKPNLSGRGTRGWEFAIDLNLSSRV